ncbi:hypothetical protein U27_05679 [Candidatus Vecturithrix granuli]|uniref:Bacterial Ig-like domain-containing protein n=1 Tax=Vecturithrix granuli TaxID=1499967 RepID=A0A081C299_VECG1|nr:hypothetical protein U27_05679 [Candidatus Vecturithrix granuli]
MMKKNIFFIGLIVILAAITGCDSGGGGPTGPVNAPVIQNSRVRPNPAFPGATLVFEIDFVDVPGDLNGGTAVITDNQGNNYQGLVSNANGTGGTLVTSITLSPLLRSGTSLQFTIFVVDLAGNSSNFDYAEITVS